VQPPSGLLGTDRPPQASGRERAISTLQCLLAAARPLRQVKAMSTDRNVPTPLGDAAKKRAGEKPPLTPAAERALAEAEARRAERDRHPADHPKEIQGRDGPEPTRYGDWEINGLTSDF
jgi:hypothetical protein